MKLIKKLLEHPRRGIRSGPLAFAMSTALVWTLSGDVSFAAVPTNDAEAFKSPDLYMDRTASQGTSDHINISSYPTFLDSPQLIAVRGSADTVCVIRSTPYDGMNMAVTNTVPQSFAEYALSTPMYMTSVALILMNYNVFNETGDFNDAGKTVARITPPGPNILRVLQNPARGPVEFILGGEDETGGVIDVFDIRGRRVEVVKVRGQTGTWDWRTAGVRPGVYFARLRSRGDETTTRFVVLH